MSTAENNNKTVTRKSFISRILPKKGYAVLFLIMAIVAVAFLAMLTVVNALPAGYTMALIIVMFVLLILACFLLNRRKKGLRILGVAVAALFLVVYGMGTYYLGHTYAMFSKISSSNESERHAVSADTGIDLANDSYNIYISGIDQWASEKGMDLERSDVNMIATICPKTRKILLTSIPRDSYIKLHTAGQMDKLTHTGVYGIDETLGTVEDWLGIDLNYYVKMNFSAVVDIIDAIGGVDVYSPKEFKPSKRSWWTVKKGWNHMSGKYALAFARERKAFNNEDSQRVENQQRVVDAILTKMMTSPALLTNYPEILKAAGDNMSTNMSTDDMQALVKMQLADLGAWDIESQKIEGEYDMDYVASLTQDQKFQVYKTDPDSVQACLDNINKVMNPTAEELAAVEQARAEKQKQAGINYLLGKLKPGSSNEEPAEGTEE
jgi:LCP family protein required for cell wall assembly